MQDIERRTQAIQKSIEHNLAQVQYFARSITHVMQMQLALEKLEQEVRLIDTDTIYIHIMTDYFKHRVFRVMKGTQPANHEKALRICFTDDGQILVEMNGLRLPLRIGESQWIHSRTSRYMITPFFSKDEAYRCKAKNSL